MAKKKQGNSLGKVKMSRHLKKEWQIYSLLLIPVLYFIIFKYIPMLVILLLSGNIPAESIYLGRNGSAFGTSGNLCGIMPFGEPLAIPLF